MKKLTPKDVDYPDGLKDANGDWIHKPVHFFLGGYWTMRCCFAEAHHGYWGIGLVALGGYLLFSPCLLVGLIGALLIAFGLWCIEDDFIDQHPTQVFKYKPLYHSYLHNAYGKFYKYKWVRKLNSIVSWFFHLFGKK